MIIKSPRQVVLFSLSLLLSSFGVLADSIKLNQPLPHIQITDKGELMINQKNNFNYQNWNSDQLLGKTHTIQHIAGRSSAKELNAPLIDAIKTAKFAPEHYQTTTIVNTDEAIFGTARFVRSSLEDSKKEFPYSQFIVDSQGQAKTAWQLADKTSAILVINKLGQVIWFKQGALTPDEVNNVIGLIESQLTQ